MSEPDAVPTHDLVRQAILARRQVELDVFKKTTIPYPEQDEHLYSTGHSALTTEDDEGGFPYYTGRNLNGTEDHGYDGDSDDSDS